MKTISKLLVSRIYMFGLLIMILSITTPLQTSAATSATLSTGTIDSSELVSNTSKPTLTGFASSTTTVKITIKKEGSTRTLYTKSTIRVHDGVWKVNVSKKLSNGTYDVTLFDQKNKRNELATSILIIDTSKKSVQKTSTTFIVESLPLLIGGNIKAGGTVPISYVQVTNVGKETAILKGFWVTQNGSAPVQSIVGFTTVDDTGSLRGSSGVEGKKVTFKNNLAFAATPDILFTAGQMRLFTVKAILASDASPYIGKQLQLNIASVDTTALVKGKFPIRGTTWNIN